MMPAMMRIRLFVLTVLVAVFPAVAGAAEKHWYKGNVHTHTLWSDGDGFPEMAVDWYKSHGYDFVALSDHNVLSVGEKWMPTREIVLKAGQVGIDAYRKRFPDVFQIRKLD